MTRRIPVWCFVLAFAVQAVLLGYMLVARADLLANGQEIRLAVIPVDPRDFLRGDYVVLSYNISTLKADELGGDDEFGYGAPVYVELAPDGDVWKAVALHRERPQAGTFLRGQVNRYTLNGSCTDWSCAIYSVDYNLEKFFVPEGEGLELEKLRNDQRVEVDVAVAEDGRAALKRLRVHGEVRYEEKLF